MTDGLIERLRAVESRLQRMWPDEIRDLTWEAANAIAALRARVEQDAVLLEQIRRNPGYRSLEPQTKTDIDAAIDRARAQESKHE